MDIWQAIAIALGTTSLASTALLVRTWQRNVGQPGREWSAFDLSGAEFDA